MKIVKNIIENEKLDVKIPIRTIERIIRVYYNGEISKNTCIEVRNLIDKTTHKIAELIVGEFQQYNLLRERQGLPSLKRLNLDVVLKQQNQLYKLINYIVVGEVGQYNSETTFSEAGVRIYA